MTISIDLATVDEIKNKVFPILQAHWDEVDTRAKSMAFAPRWDLYQQLQEMRAHFALVAKDGDKYIGYCSNFVQPALHAETSTQLVTEAFFVSPKYRGTGLAKAMMESIMKLGKVYGANYWTMNLKEYQKHDSLMDTMEMELTEQTFTRCI